jgi:transposase
MIILASASGNTAPAIAALVAADPDTVRDVIHNFNEHGLACLDPHWAGGRLRTITADDEAFIVATAKTRPRKLGRPFTHWSIRKLADYLDNNPTHQVRIGRERLRQLLHHHGISFQRTRTWKQTTDPDADAKLDRIEEVTGRFPDGAPIYVIIDNWSGNKTRTIRTWAAKHNVELCFHPDRRVLGQPDRTALRPATRLRARQLRPAQPPGTGPPPTVLPALAQHPPPPPHRFGGATPRTRPSPQRTPPTMGTPMPTSRMITQHGKRSWSTH